MGGGNPCLIIEELFSVLAKFHSVSERRATSDTINHQLGEFGQTVSAKDN